MYHVREHLPYNILHLCVWVHLRTGNNRCWAKHAGLSIIHSDAVIMDNGIGPGHMVFFPLSAISTFEVDAAVITPVPGF